MPILTQKNEVAITITYKCNWTCEYCAVRNNHDYKDNVTHDDVLSKISKIEDNSVVTIFGGEPGLVERKYIEEYIYLIQQKNCTLWLETNGTFIKNYPDLIVKFDGILYHCSQDLELDDKLLICQHHNVHYMIIVHDKNMHKLDKFIHKHNNIIFDIVEATYPYPEMSGPTLSKINKNHIIAKYGNHMTKESLSRLLNGKDFDSIEFLT